jgi:hypothetical protein
MSSRLCHRAAIENVVSEACRRGIAPLPAASRGPLRGDAEVPDLVKYRQRSTLLLQRTKKLTVPTDKPERGKRGREARKPGPGRPERHDEADVAESGAGETGGPSGPEPTRFGDWERKGRCIDF